MEPLEEMIQRQRDLLQLAKRYSVEKALLPEKQSILDGMQSAIVGMSLLKEVTDEVEDYDEE